MLELQRIFVPLDFSRSSRAAVSAAGRWAQATNARLHMAHAVAPVMPYTERTLFPYASLGEDRVSILGELRDNARDALGRYHNLSEMGIELGRRSAAKGADDAGHRLEVVMADAQQSAFGALVTQLDASDAQLIVAGHSEKKNSGGTGWYDVVANGMEHAGAEAGHSGSAGQTPGAYGATALHILLHAASPTLLVRDIPGKDIRKVTVALDLSAHSQKVLQIAVAAALLHEASLDILVVAPEPLVYDVRGIVSGVVKADPKAIKRAARRESHKIIDRFEAELDIPFPWRQRHELLKPKRTGLVGDPAEQAVSWLANQEMDLLVVGTHGERRASLARRLGRTAYDMGANAPCHTLFVP